MSSVYIERNGFKKIKCGQCFINSVEYYVTVCNIVFTN